MKRKFGLVGVGALIGLALMLAGWQVFSGPYQYKGSLINPPVPAADFQLTDQFGQPFRLSDQRGKLVLVFFGYTNCPDVCPITLTEFKQIKQDLGARAQDVRFVFITVDPQRDTQEQLRTHLANFDPSIVGLTGDQATLAAVWKDYGVYQSKEDTGSAAGYVVDHSAFVYAIDRKGNWRLTLPFGMETSDMFQDISHLIQEK